MGKKFKSGAVRSELAPAFDQLVPEALFGVARRFAQGEEKYSRDNWKKAIGDKAFIRQVYAHMMAHLVNEWASNLDDTGEDLGNLNAIGWAHHVLTWFKTYDRETYDAARESDV